MGEDDEEKGRTYELEAVLVGATIEGVEIEDDRLRISLAQRGSNHLLEFVKQDPRQPPMADGSPHNVAFTAGSIADYVVFQPERATLLV